MVSLGAKGCCASDGSTTVSAAAHCVEVADTIGAGDSFVAGFLHAYLAKAPLQVCPLGSLGSRSRAIPLPFG